MVAPVLDKIAKEQAGKLLVGKVNMVENAEWAMQYSVQCIPTKLFIANGKVIHRQVGLYRNRCFARLLTLPCCICQFATP
jgi:thioredoxin 1